MRHLAWSLSVAAIALLFVLPPVWGSPLEGVHALEVVVEALPPDLLQSGLTPAQMRADVLRRLSGSGISVDPTSPTLLYVTCTAERKAGIYALRVQVGVEPRVLLAQASSLMELPRTRWQLTGLSIADQLLASDVHTLVLDLVDRFIDAYREQHSNQ